MEGVGFGKVRVVVSHFLDVCHAVRHQDIEGRHLALVARDQGM